MRAHVLLAILCALLAPSAAGAQVVSDSARVRLDTLRVPVTRSSVEASRAPVALSRVDRSDIQDARATMGLDESLASVPGLIVDNRQNFSLGSRIVIRGLGARAAFGVRGVRMLVDGLPLTMPDGQTNLNNLDLGSAGAIHVMRGPASALYGNAAGGVIVIDTEPAPGPRSAEARVTIGDQGRGTLTRLVKAQVRAAETIGPFDYHASLSRMNADGFRDHSRARQTMLNARAGYRLSEATKLSFVINAVDVPLAENPGALPVDSFAATPRMAWPRNVATGAGESTRQTQIGARLVRTTTSSRTDVSAYGLRRTLENPLPFGFIDLARWAGGVRAQHEQTVGSWSFVAGVDGEAQSDERQEFENVDGRPTGDARRDQNDRVASLGPFAQARVDAGPALLMLGARYDVVHFETTDHRDPPDAQSGRRTLHSPSFMAAASLPAGDVVFFANLATSFQTPTTTELLNAPPEEGQPCCPAGFNTSLEPQRTLSAEAGMRGSHGAVGWELTAYTMNVRDALVQFQVPGVEGRDFFRNAGRTRHRGIEAGVGAALGRGVSVSASYAYTDVRFREDGDTTSFEGNRVPGITPHTLFASAGWTRRGTSVTAEVQHHGSQYANDANTVESDGWTRLDLRLQTALSIGGVEAAPFLVLGNILDEEYPGSLTVNAAAGRYFEPAPGFNIVMGMSVRTGAWRAR